MGKIPIKLINLGKNIHGYSSEKVRKWKLDVFCITTIETLALPEYSDGIAWEYSDAQISKVLDTREHSDIVLAVTSVPLEDNYYMRRLKGNKVVITLFQVGEILSLKNIPLENFILKSIYEICLLYALYRDKEIPMSELASVAHDETRGCLFDMTGIKQDIAISSKSPILCDVCYGKYMQEHVSVELLNKIRQELKKIQLPRYEKIVAAVRRRPIISLSITILVSISLSVSRVTITSHL